jgi:hypothetical protein
MRRGHRLCASIAITGRERGEEEREDYDDEQEEDEGEEDAVVEVSRAVLDPRI